MKEIVIKIRPEGIVIFDRQSEILIDDTLDILSQLDNSDDSINEFLHGRKLISLIIGKEIYCG